MMRYRHHVGNSYRSSRMSTPLPRSGRDGTGAMRKRRRRTCCRSAKAESHPQLGYRVPVRLTRAEKSAHVPPSSRYVERFLQHRGKAGLPHMFPDCSIPLHTAQQLGQATAGQGRQRRAVAGRGRQGPRSVLAARSDPAGGSICQTGRLKALSRPDVLPVDNETSNCWCGIEKDGGPFVADAWTGRCGTSERTGDARRDLDRFIRRAYAQASVHAIRLPCA